MEVKTRADDEPLMCGEVSLLLLYVNAHASLGF